MNDYGRVEEALKAGADPAMLCATCPWDRFCITPPEMTAEEVEAKIKEAEEKDRQRDEARLVKGETPGMPVGMLLTAVTLGGRHRQANLCPVFAITLRTSQGKHLVDSLKTQMQRDAAL